jgi:hypothetical protein
MLPVDEDEDEEVGGRDLEFGVSVPSHEEEEQPLGPSIK